MPETQQQQVERLLSDLSREANRANEMEDAIYALLEIFHQVTDCGKNGHWPECVAITDACGWASWEAWEAMAEGLA